MVFNVSITSYYHLQLWIAMLLSHCKTGKHIIIICYHYLIHVWPFFLWSHPLPRLCHLLLAARCDPNCAGGAAGAAGAPPLAIAVAAQHTVSWRIVTWKPEINPCRGGGWGGEELGSYYRNTRVTTYDNHYCSTACIFSRVFNHVMIWHKSVWFIWVISHSGLLRSERLPVGDGLLLQTLLERTGWRLQQTMTAIERTVIIEGSLEVKLPTIWTDEKQSREEAERRERLEERRVRRKKMQMREKVGKSRNTVFFQWCGAPEGRKVGSLKRRVRSQLARWEMKNCTPLWREAHFQVKMYKTHQVRTTFGSWDVEKVHVVVARSTFPSQNVQNTPWSEHFWKLRCRKSARFQVKMYKTLGVRTTFGSWDVEKVHAVVARSTFGSQKVQKH